MTPVETWEQEKQAHAAHLYTLLTALVGDIETLRHTHASLSWRTAADVQGHWRVEGGQVWLGHVCWTEEGRVSEQLVLALATVGDGAAVRRVVHPIAHACRSADGPVGGSAPDTPQIYEAAQALLLQLGTELHTMVPALSPPQEVSP